MSMRRKYDEDFKRRTVQMRYSSKRSIQEISDSLGIHHSMLHRWRQKYTPLGEKTVVTEQSGELQRLLRRIAELDEENDILKKASAFFARHQR